MKKILRGLVCLAARWAQEPIGMQIMDGGKGMFTS